MDLESLLGQIGLSPKESRLYLAILKQRRATPAELARLTKINRATIYHLAIGLVSRGMVAEDLGGTKRSFVALPPSALEQLIEHQRKELQLQEGLVRQAVAKLSIVTAAKEYPVPKVHFVEEGQLRKFLYDEHEQWLRSMVEVDPDRAWWGFQDHTLVEHYSKWIDWTWKQNPKYKIRVNLLSNESSVERRYKGKYVDRHIKFLGDQTNFTATTWVTGDFVSMVHTREHPHYLVEIHDARFAQNMRALFKEFWYKVT